MLKGLDSNFIAHEDTRTKWPVKMQVFGPANNYSAESWVDQYHRKSWIRKIFEETVGVQEVGLRDIQSRMVWQAVSWAFIMTTPLTIGFLAVPSGNMFPN